MRYRIVKQHDGTFRLLRDGTILHRSINVKKIEKGRPTLVELEFWSEIKRLRKLYGE